PALVVLALAAIAAFVASRRLPDAAVEPPRFELRFALGLLGALLVYGWVANLYQMHDEHPIFGHKSMIEQLRWGEYPPYFPPLPEQDARYHYGFDVLSGALARAYGLS